MRIGLFTDTYPPYINGVSTSVYMLKKALEKQGHEVYVVTVNNTNAKYKMEDNNTIIRVPGIPIGIYDYRITGIYPLKAMNQVKKWKLDVIHSHTEFGIGTFARLMAKQLHIPLIHTYHTMWEDYTYYITHGYFKKASDKVVEYLTKFYCDKTANALIVPTKKIFDLFKNKYGYEKDINIIPTGIEIERFYQENVSKDEVSELKKKLNINKKDFVITFVGRIAQEKNIEFLIDAQKDLVKQYNNIKLIIIGDGPELKTFKKQADEMKLKDSIIFTGKVPWNDIPKYYQLSTVFATASTTETQGLTVIEAMAGGVMPICIDDESFRNTVENDKNGKLFTTKAEYKDIITTLHNDDKLLKKLSNQARIDADRYSSKNYAEAVLKVYESCINVHNQKKKFGSIPKIFKSKKDQK